ncbi:unnamed protein product, partial [Mesorhabditis spiculigera]
MAGTPKPPEPALALGDKLHGGRFIVRKKLGEGSCGSVWAVDTIPGAVKYAMKVEPFQKTKEEEILRMELYVLKKLQTSKHVPRFVASGDFMVMTLLGKDLVDCRRKCRGRKVSAQTTLRLSLQAVQSLEDMHRLGFIHRDVKPCNFALGLKNNKMLYIIDFGLCRQFMLPDKNGKMKLREARAKVSFRGTVRYCSTNVHAGKEQGRHDDLYGLLYSMIETATGTLPWKGMPRVDSAKCKEKTTDAVLLKGCPPAFTEFAGLLKKLTYPDAPPYDKIRAAIAKNIKELNVKMTDPYDWERLTKTERRANKEKEMSTKDGPEKDKDADNDTTKDLAESVLSQTSESINNDEEVVEDTLDQAPERMKTEDGDNPKSHQ